MSLEIACDHLAAALRRAVAAHGEWNQFTPAELHIFFGGPKAVLAGRIGRRHILALRMRLSASGATWAERVTYSPSGTNHGIAVGPRFVVREP